MIRRRPIDRGAAHPGLLLVVSLVLLLAGGCSGGGGGSSPTEPSPNFQALQVNWEYYVAEDEGPETGTGYPIAGSTVVLLNRQGQPSNCSRDGEVWMECLVIFDDDGEFVEVVYQPENVRYIAECRTTSEGEVQAYYHDPYSHINPGTVGPLVTSGCSRAEEWDHYAQCCLDDS